MQLADSFTVADVLKRPLFQNAKVIAGMEGVDRPVRWVHVLEIMDGSSYVKGGELVLMTGVGLGNEKELKLDYVRELVESNVSALAIEMVHQFVEIPEVVKQFADEQHFPIIIFEEPVSFIEITQDIHTRLIAKHQDQLLALERISTQFLQLTLQPQGLKKILQLLHKETALVVWLEDYLEKTFIYPEDEKPVKKNSICRPITVLDVHIGNLYIRKDRELTEYLNLILDRAIIAIAQERLRQILMEEWEMKEGRKWMIDLIRKGKGDIPSSLLSAIQKRNAMVLCAIERKQLGSHDESGMERVVFVQLFRMVQHIFQTKGIYAWMAPVENQWAIVLADNQSYLSESFIQRTEGGFADLFQQFHRLHPHLQYQWKVGISHTFYDLTQIPQAWHQATLALSVNGVPTGEVEAKAVKNGLPFRIISYAKLQAWQLFLQLDPIAVQEFVEFHLGPLLAHDQKNGTDLVRTLEVFLQNGRQKKQTANSLFIHRQTLYYRLEQITSMLGEDWESPLRCLALEMALAGYRFLLAQQEGRPNSR